MLLQLSSPLQQLLLRLLEEVVVLQLLSPLPGTAPADSVFVGPAAGGCRLSYTRRFINSSPRCSRSACLRVMLFGPSVSTAGARGSGQGGGQQLRGCSLGGTKGTPVPDCAGMQILAPVSCRSGLGM